MLLKLLLHTIFFSFVLLTSDLVKGQTTDTYQKEIDDWHAKRKEFLLSPSGWINLEGLFWLKPGRNTFGSAKTNDIVYPNQAFPKLAGYFIWEKEKVNWITNDKTITTINDMAITKTILFEEGSTPPLVALDNFRWSIIKREDKMGVRLRNLHASALKTFKKIKHFPVSEKWRVTAHLEKASSTKLFITNVFGQTISENSPGKLLFTIQGKNYQMDALTEEDQLFILFGDATNGKTTYPTGRFLYAQIPDANGNTILDFNKAYNPPCAFTVYASCPLPPKQNVLPFTVEAGEKDYSIGGKK